MLDIIKGALARGYCDNVNASKIVDPVLIEAMAKEVMAAIEGAVIDTKPVAWSKVSMFDQHAPRSPHLTDNVELKSEHFRPLDVIIYTSQEVSFTNLPQAVTTAGQYIAGQTPDKAPSVTSTLVRVFPNDDEVICPKCVHQFRAIPVNIQQKLLAAGHEPPFK